MKESGIPWLGRIPSHWIIKAFKHVTNRIIVGIAEAATHAYVDNGTPIIRSTNVKPNYLETSDLLYIKPEFAEQNSSKYLQSGDIVTVRTGNAGISAVVPDSLDKSQCFTLLVSTLRPNQNPQFYCYLLNAEPGKTTFRLEGWGTAQINISVPILQNLIVVEPPYSEQNDIVAFIDSKVTAINEYIDGVKVQIEKLQEYRTAVISAAVTGKIDVCDTIILQHPRKV